METEIINSNIGKTKKIVQELLLLEEIYGKSSSQEKEFIEKASNSLLQLFFLLNNSLGGLIEKTLFNYAEKDKQMKTRVEAARIETTSGPVFILPEDKAKFIQEMKIEKDVLRKIRENKGEQSKKDIERPLEVEPSSRLIRISNQMFREFSSALAKTSIFSSIEKDLKKANIPYRIISYISLTLFLTLISFVLAAAVSFFLGIENLLRNFLLLMLVPITVFVLMMLAPSQKADTTKKMLENELPFAVSNLAAIASSNIEPTKIFAIMASSYEFPAFSKESKKIVNQVNFYGYDLTTALRNVAKNTASVGFGELLNGISTNITSGGNLSVYLNEKSKDYMLDYKLSRERYANTIGIYSDIYTALLIAAPLLFMLLLIVISMIGTSIGGLSVQNLAMLGIGAIAVLNVLFLLFLNFTQPEL